MPSKRELAEAVSTLQEQVESYGVEYANLSESIAELELSLEDQGWINLLMLGELEFSRDGLRNITKIARLMYLKNPLIQQGVDVQTRYVFGQGVEITAQHEEANEIVQAFLEDARNKAELTSHQARMGKETDMQVESNIFFVFFVDTRSASFRVKARTIPFDEIDDIIFNPDDRREPWFYRRSWTQQHLNYSSGLYNPVYTTAYYPDWRYSGNRLTERIGEHPIMWDYPIYHVKTGGLSSMKFGVPEVYSALDWARAYKEFLENWSTIVKAYAKFAMKLTTKGGAAGVTAANAKLGTTLGSTSGETNPPPLTGSLWATTEGVDIQPIRTAGATTSAEDGRRLLLMVAASMGLPESFFGDVSVGTLATAKSLDRPTELKMKSRQTLWADILSDICEYVIVKAVEAGQLQGRLEDEEDGTPRVYLAGDGEEVRARVDVTFPPILEHDVSESVEAIIKATTLDGKTLAGTMELELTARLLLSVLGVENIDDIIGEMFPADGEPQGEAGRIRLAALKEFKETVAEIRSSLESS